MLISPSLTQPDYVDVIKYVFQAQYYAALHELADNQNPSRRVPAKRNMHVILQHCIAKLEFLSNQIYLSSEEVCIHETIYGLSVVEVADVVRA